MTIVRALLALLWMILGLTATAHAGTMTAGEPACHMSAADMANMPEAPKRHHTDQSAMPCCSQPVVVAPAQPLVPTVIRIDRARLYPSPVVPLHGTVVPYEPHPPKAG